MGVWGVGSGGVEWIGQGWIGQGWTGQGWAGRGKRTSVMKHLPAYLQPLRIIASEHKSFPAAASAYDARCGGARTAHRASCHAG